jgi:hypothetical protein
MLIMQGKGLMAKRVHEIGAARKTGGPRRNFQ